MNADAAIWRSIKQMPATAQVELEQAIVRVAIPGLVLVCFAGYAMLGGELSVIQLHALWFTIGFFLLGVGLTLWIVAKRNVSVVRRYIGIVADNACITYFMLIAGEQGAAIWWIYLFITFGNGFRYGRRYLLVSQALSLLGFAVVCYSLDFWSHHLWVAVGLFLAMVELPVYVAVLVSRMVAAKNRSEAALQATQKLVRELFRRDMGRDCSTNEELEQWARAAAPVPQCG